MTGVSFDDVNALILAAAGVPEGGSLARGQPDPADIRRPYITAGHAADSPANRHGAQPVPMPDPATGGRSTTPPDSSERGEDGREVQKVSPDRSRADMVDWAAALSSEAERFGGPAGPVPSPDFRVAGADRVHRGPLTAGHESPSPADAGDSNPASPVTGSGHATYEHGVTAYNANVQQACADHVMPSQAREARPAPSQWSPPPGMQADAVPRPVNPGHLTGHAPGDR